MIKKSEVVTLLKAPFKVKLYDTVASTNDAALHCRPFTAVIAKQQRHGRGRLGRVFVSNRGGIYMSLALPEDDIVMLTVKAAVAVVRAVRAVTGRDCRIKWVNDVFLNGKKLCGILCEKRAGSNVTVVGIGINYCNRLPKTLLDIATTLAKGEQGMGELAAAVINELYDILEKDVLDEYKRLSLVLNRYIRVGGRKYFAEDIDTGGGLLLVGVNGERRKVLAGEVSLLPADL